MSKYSMDFGRVMLVFFSRFKDTNLKKNQGKNNIAYQKNIVIYILVSLIFRHLEYIFRKMYIVNKN